MSEKKQLIILVLVVVSIFVVSSVVLKTNDDIEIKKEIIESGDMALGDIKETDGEVKHISSNEFGSEVLKSENVVLVDFYATWCGPCKTVAPILEEIAKEDRKIKIVKVDVDESEDISADYNVMYIPTLVIIKDGEEVDRIVGAAKKAEIQKMIEAHCK